VVVVDGSQEVLLGLEVAFSSGLTMVFGRL